LDEPNDVADVGFVSQGGPFSIDPLKRFLRNLFPSYELAILRGVPRDDLTGIQEPPDNLQRRSTSLLRVKTWSKLVYFPEDGLETHEIFAAFPQKCVPERVHPSLVGHGTDLISLLLTPGILTSMAAAAVSWILFRLPPCEGASIRDASALS
jgi:hypothetical protein